MFSGGPRCSVAPGGFPLGSALRFRRTSAADSSEVELEAVVAVQEAVGGGVGSSGGTDHIMVRTPPTSPIITVGAGRGAAGAALWAGGFIPSSVRTKGECAFLENRLKLVALPHEFIFRFGQ